MGSIEAEFAMHTTAGSRRTITIAAIVVIGVYNTVVSCRVVVTLSVLVARWSACY